LNKFWTVRVKKITFENTGWHNPWSHRSLLPGYKQVRGFTITGTEYFLGPSWNSLREVCDFWDRKKFLSQAERGSVEGSSFHIYLAINQYSCPFHSFLCQFFKFLAQSNRVFINCCIFFRKNNILRMNGIHA
jgi:hypothetical protein